MSKQEKIRRESVEICMKSGIEWTEATYLVDFIFTYLHSQGVAIRNPKEPLTMEELIMYGTLEPLIEKEK